MLPYNDNATCCRVSHVLMPETMQPVLSSGTCTAFEGDKIYCCGGTGHIDITEVLCNFDACTAAQKSMTEKQYNSAICRARKARTTKGNAELVEMFSKDPTVLWEVRASCKRNSFQSHQMSRLQHLRSCLWLS